MSNDIEKLINEKPEMFDYPDITDLNVCPKYQAAMDKLVPQWAKDLARSDMISEANDEEFMRQS